MRGVNKVTLVGNLGDDPTVRYTQAGAAVTTISLATSESWKDKEGELQERTSWHRVQFFGRLAEVAGEYLKKGARVYIEGSLRYGSYEKEGVTHYTTDIVAQEMLMLDGARGDSGEGPAQRGGGGRSSGGGQRGGGGRGGDYGSRSSPSREPVPEAQRNGAPSDDPFPDDDIPF